MDNIISLGRSKKLFFGRRRIGKLLCLIVFFWAINAQGNIIYPLNIFNNPTWQQDSRLSFTVSVSDEGQNRVGFLFENSSTISSSITAIYFDDDSLLNITESIAESEAVSFSQGAKPESLPAGNILNPPFDKHPYFSTDSDSPTFHNGINENDWLKIIFTLNNNRTFNDVIESISNSGAAESLRIGIHIQGLPNGDSVSAINSSGTSQIPEPATIIISTTGLMGILLNKN